MSMKRPRFNMGRVQWIGCEALGLPGQRTFRVLAMADHASAGLWLEKEQLQALAEAVARMLAEIGGEVGMDFRQASQGQSNTKPPDFPEEPDIEIHVGALGLRYDAQRDLIALEAFDRDAGEEDPPALRCLANRTQMESLQTQSIEVLAAGRPKCPLCGTPLSAPGMPHFCPPTNGHQRLTPDDE